MRMRGAALAALIIALSAAPPVRAQAPLPAVAASLAPSGRLRAAINTGNVVLAQRDPATGQLRGVAADLAQALGKSLSLPVDLIAYDSANQAFVAGQKGDWDVAFMAVDPLRADKIAFTAPYVVVGGTYLVRSDAPFKAVEDLDRDGVRIAVGQGAAYDLFLSRALKHAQLVRAPTSAAAIVLFQEQHLDAAAGVRTALVQAAGREPGLRVIDPGFQRIEQAVALPKGHDAAFAYVRVFVERMKAGGQVRASLDKSGQTDASVAPPAP